MGLFSRRRKRESAIPEDELEAAGGPLGSFASAEGQPVVGSQVGGGQVAGIEGLSGLDGLAMLAQLGPMIQKAMVEGNAQVSIGEPRSIDMRGTELGDQIREIMARHGIDAESATARGVDASAYGEMQKEILDALARAGIDHDAAGSEVDLRIDRPGG